MSDIKLVIKIDKEIYENIIKNGFIYDEDNEYVTHSIKKSTPLPKGHGRLADMDEAIKCIEEVTDSKEKQYALNLVDWACSKRVLIEADKEEE